MFNRVAVFAASPAAALLALLLELLLCLGVGKAKVELNAGVVNRETVEVLDDSLGDLACFEAGIEVSARNDGSVPSHTERTQLPC